MSLYSSHQVVKTEKSVKSSQSIIQEYEQAGNYVKALDLAQLNYQKLLNQKSTQEAANFLKIVNCLEEKLLTFGYSRLLFDENEQPRDKLLELLKMIGMKSLDKSEKPILQINNWAQKNLLRQGERWQKQTDRFEELKPKIEFFLRELGFIDASFPHFKKYQGAIVHGALLSSVRCRLSYLIEQWKKGIRFSHLYFLSGERPLDPMRESKNVFFQDENSSLKIRKDGLELTEFPTTEYEMVQLLWKQSEIPEDMRKHVQVHFINAPMKKDPQSESFIRPTTDDTIQYWLKTEPPYGRYLAVTQAPYMNRQDLVVRKIASKEYLFDTVGSSAHEQEKIAIILDELARCIFQTKQIFEK
jgi:hypothetical protein